MSNHVIVTGDKLQITVNPPAVVPSVASPLPLNGTGLSTKGGMKVCLDGDENLPLFNSPQPYTTATHTVPGMVKIVVNLPPAYKSKTAKDSNKPMLIKGTGPWDVMITVQTPAQTTSTPPVPDPVATKPAKGQFITMNTVVEAK